MRLSLSLALVLVLAGCAHVSSAPPDSQIDVAEAYAEAITGADLAVVVSAVAVTDEAVGTHLGGGDLDAAYRAFFTGALPAAFETADVGEVRVFDAAAVGADAAAVDASALAFPGFEPGLVLLLDTLHVDRATYYTDAMGAPGPNGVMQTMTTKKEALRLDTRIRLWDRARGAEVALGQLDTERALPPVGRSRATYEDGVREFVEQLARFTPLTLRGD